MAIYFITALVIGVVIAAMAVGVIFGRAPIKGSCGGLGAVGIDQSCEICGGNPQRCEEETRQGSAAGKQADSASFYSADKQA